jgi:ribosomal protein S27AE
VGVGDQRREGGHGADHGRRRTADHPVATHRPAPRLVAEAAPLDAVRCRISAPYRLRRRGVSATARGCTRIDWARWTPRPASHENRYLCGRRIVKACGYTR